METDHILIGALLVIVLIVGINAAMYGIVRGITRGGKSSWISAISKSLYKPLENSTNRSIGELRKKIEELDETKKEDK